MNDFTIHPRGPFSWKVMTDTWFQAWEPALRHRVGRDGRLRIAFPLDVTFEPVGVCLDWADGELRGEFRGQAEPAAVRDQVARIFSLDIDASSYPELGRRDPDLGRVMDRFWGLRPLLFTSPYEAAAWGVLSQRISMRQAAAVQERLLAAHGHRLVVAGSPVIAFPAPARLLEVVSVPGLAAVKMERLHGVARAALEGRLDPAHLRALGPKAGPASLRSIAGIGPFWSLGVYLRGAGFEDLFPIEPLGIRALAGLKGLDHQPEGAELDALVAAYRPWRTWACVLLRIAAGRPEVRPG